MSRGKMIGVLVVVLLVILSLLGAKIFMDNFEWHDAPPVTNDNTKYVKQESSASVEEINSDIEYIISELNKEESQEASIKNVEVSLKEGSNDLQESQESQKSQESQNSKTNNKNN